MFTSTRLHAQKHMWHDRSKVSPAAAQEDAQQHTARTLKTLPNRSRVSRIERVRKKQAKTRARKQEEAGKHPARDPPGTAHRWHGVRGDVCVVCWSDACALVGRVLFGARAALACARGLACLMRVCYQWFPALVPDCWCILPSRLFVTHCAPCMSS